MKQLILPALMLASPLLAACEPETPRTVTVTAEGWAVEPAHYAVVELYIGARAETRAGALEQAQALFTTLEEQLPQLDGLESFDLRTQELDIQQDCPRGQNRTIFVGAPCDALAYVVSQDITITLSPVRLAGNMASLANELGVLNVELGHFVSADAEALRRAAAQHAFTNARESAAMMAEASGLELGEIISIQPSNDYYRPPPMPSEPQAIVVTGQRLTPASQLEIAPEDVREIRQIEVVFELVDPAPDSDD
ncbi:MAG: SIMPL domain-containing protein [Oceanicaulis sp.]|jgi:uncharacterized protein YggE|nr:SIMPL domain-containing protein [Oceanicaulis sp.]